MNKIEFLKKSYEYQQSWIAHANSAAAIGITVFGFFLTWIFSNNFDFFSNFIIINYIVLFLSLASVFFFLKIIFPTTKSSKSLIYFRGIKSRSLEEYKKSILEINEDVLIKEYSEQVYILAGIAEKKFFNLKVALYLAVIAFIAFLIFSFNYNKRINEPFNYSGENNPVCSKKIECSNQSDFNIFKIY